MSEPRTLHEKIWDAHLVRELDGDTCLLWIDRHLVHEVSSPQAFESLRLAGRSVRRPELTLAVADHSVSTSPGRAPVDHQSKLQIDALEKNASDFRIEHIGLHDPRQGIVHVVGPEQGFTLPGMTVACGDSHTSTHGALGALAFGVGTSDVEHVLATQTIRTRKFKTIRVEVSGPLEPFVGAKDVALAIVSLIGSGGATGSVIEFDGSTVRAMSVEGRMTLCNMAIECGARTALIAPDEKVFEYVAGRRRAPADHLWASAVENWRGLRSDPDARFDRSITIDASTIEPLVTWGTSPDQTATITARVPDPDDFTDPRKQESARRALSYMDLKPGTALEDVRIENVFIGSCTNSRIEDLRDAARVLKGRKIAAHIRQALVVPGSGMVKIEAEAEGLDQVFRDAGFEWREPGCSMCIGMNGDRVPPGERCASTSNRNFAGRQGPGARTHLLSPAMAAAASIAGHLADVRELCG